ncbi:heme-thiolate peroxidase [Xylaria arbuscula]|uniref:Heme-thiolate peroxidase n=1 Tax=Xylaria arbuscula TaxID=114810 RepID=A0A9W8N2T2_9PEZI|nr:heme-thiolate peroxidase [Xylaria arbuscula]
MISALIHDLVISSAVRLSNTIDYISPLLYNWFEMRFQNLALALAMSSHVNSQTFDGPDPAHPWIAAGPDDFRGPCPMMNTLANHGYLQRDGRNITRENAVNALKEGLNFNPTLANIMFDQAIIANPEPNATYFTLDQLNKHNLLEHDASLRLVTPSLTCHL